MSDDARQDERDARERERRNRLLQAARRKAVEREARRMRTDVIREEKRAHPECRCQIPRSATYGELVSLGAGCTAGRYVCPCLDAIRRRLRSGS